MLDAAALDTLFRTARTHDRWTDAAVDEQTLRELYGLLSMGPTSANSQPGRFAFLSTAHAREKLRPALSQGNVEKTMAAPVVAIVAYDPAFYDKLPELYPQADARAWFAGNADLAEETAFRNGTLQGGYLILAARAVGLDAGPMSGFDRDMVDALFFRDSGWRSNFLITLGHGEAPVHARNPRLGFDDACVIV